MLGRLLTSAGIAGAGYGMIRRGKSLRNKASRMKEKIAGAPAQAVAAKRADLISRVRQTTRGLHGTTPEGARLFSKHTKTGQARRAQAAAMIRSKRAGLPAGQTHRSLQAARSRAIVHNVKGLTQSIVPSQNIAKKTTAASTVDKKSRQLNRYHLAQFLKQARKGPTQGYYNRAGETFDLRKKRKFQGPKI
jgi:hypothetical protein